jgi:hypothetical protein
VALGAQPQPQPGRAANAESCSPAVLPYREGLPIAPGYRLESEPKLGLAYGGLAVFAAPYVTGLIAAAASGFTKDSGWLAVPLAGPFVAMGGRSIECSFIESTSAGTTTDLNKKEAACRDSALKEARVVALLTVAGLVQTAGAIMTIAGLASRDEYLIRKDLSQDPNSEQPKVKVDGGYSNGQVRLTAQINF